MKLSDAATVMKGGLRGDDAFFYGASSDTRLLKPGELFFAWRGENSDAHDFLDSAEANGAIAAVVERYISSSEIRQIQVADSQRSLGLLAKAWRKRWRGQLIALTGSNGKTTLKEMLNSILSLEAETLATEGNYNNHIGCPLTLLKLNENHQYGVIEMGANHPQEIRYLTKIAAPNIAIINNVGASHLEGFGSFEGVANAKAEIFEGLSPDGIAIINADDSFADLWRVNVEAAGQKQISFGIENRADCFATEIKGNQFQLNYGEQQIQISLQLLGYHNIMNALGAATTAFSLGVSIEHIKEGLERLTPVSGRLESVKIHPQVTLINDGYNANPNSLRAGIDALSTLGGENDQPNDQRWLVLGDMGELGAESESLHRSCGEYAKKHQINALYTLGHLAEQAGSTFGANAYTYDTHDALALGLAKAIKEFYEATPDCSLMILIKGSNSMNMPQIIDKLRALI